MSRLSCGGREKGISEGHTPQVFINGFRLPLSVPVTTQVSRKQPPSVWPGKLARSHQRDSEQSSCTEALCIHRQGLYTSHHHFHTSQTQIEGCSLHHVNRALLWLRIDVVVSHSPSLILSTKSVKLFLLPLYGLWCSNVVCHVCMKASVLVLSLPSKPFYAWGKWSGRSRGRAARLR